MIIFEAGFAMASQILMVADPERRLTPRIGTATARTCPAARRIGRRGGLEAVLAAGLRHWLPRELHGRVPEGITATSTQSTPARDRPRSGQLAAQRVLVAAPIALAGS
jgi:hypothetical protein